MKEIIEKMKTTKILAGIGIAGLILGTILPYVSYSIFGYKYTISLWNYWEGKVILLLAIANLVFIFKDFVEKWIPSLSNSWLGQKANNPKYSLVPTILSAIFAIYVTSILGIDSFKFYSIGFYLMWIGTICLVAYAFLHKGQEQNINTSENVSDNTSNNSSEKMW